MVRHPGFSSVIPRDWGDRPVAIVGGGPSLRGFDFDRLRGRFTVLAVNASMFDIPFADAGFSIDRKAMREWWARLRQLRYPQYYAVPDFDLPGITIPPTTQMHFLLRRPGNVFDRRPGCISAGGTSGFGALHLAYHRGARKIILLGFDYGGRGGNWHHNEQHYGFRQTQDAKNWAQWARNFDHAAAVLCKSGVEVINASPESAITVFPRITVEEALK